MNDSAAENVLRAGQDVDRSVRKSLAADLLEGPTLAGLGHTAHKRAHQVRGLGEEIGREVADHEGPAAAVFTQVEDQGVDAGQKRHGAVSRCLGLGTGEAAQVDVADVALEDLHSHKSMVVLR